MVITRHKALLDPLLVLVTIVGSQSSIIIFPVSNYHDILFPVARDNS